MTSLCLFLFPRFLHSSPKIFVNIGKVRVFLLSKAGGCLDIANHKKRLEDTCLLLVPFLQGVFTYKFARFRDVPLAAGTAPRARLWQRAVVHEVIVPLISRPATELAEHVFRDLHVELSKMEPADDFLQNILRQVKLIVSCLLALAGDTAQPQSAVTTVMGGKAGILLLTADAIQQSPAWQGRFASWTRWEAAITQHGPALNACQESLRDPSLADMDDALKHLPTWKDCLREGEDRTQKLFWSRSCGQNKPEFGIHSANVGGRSRLLCSCTQNFGGI